MSAGNSPIKCTALNNTKPMWNLETVRQNLSLKYCLFPLFHTFMCKICAFFLLAFDPENYPAIVDTCSRLRVTFFQANKFNPFKFQSNLWKWFFSNICPIWILFCRLRDGGGVKSLVKVQSKRIYRNETARRTSSVPITFEVWFSLPIAFKKATLFDAKVHNKYKWTQTEDKRALLSRSKPFEDCIELWTLSTAFPVCQAQCSVKARLHVANWDEPSVFLLIAAISMLIVDQHPPFNEENFPGGSFCIQVTAVS